jgi:hypothetical protein
MDAEAFSRSGHSSWDSCWSSFNVFEQYVFRERRRRNAGCRLPKKCNPGAAPRRGLQELSYLLGVMAAAMLNGYFDWPKGVQESIMILMALLSWFTTPKSVHQHNHFHFHRSSRSLRCSSASSCTMIPALEILNARAAS